MDKKKQSDVGGGGPRADLPGKVTLEQTLRRVRRNHVSTRQSSTMRQVTSDTVQKEQEAQVTGVE